MRPVALCVLRTLETISAASEDAGVRRNGAFNPGLWVVVTRDLRLCYNHGVEPPGKRALLFTIVPRDGM